MGKHKSFKITKDSGIDSGVKLNIIANHVCISKHDKFAVDIYEDEVESLVLSLQEIQKYFLSE